MAGVGTLDTAENVRVWATLDSVKRSTTIYNRGEFRLGISILAVVISILLAPRLWRAGDSAIGRT